MVLWTPRLLLLLVFGVSACFSAASTFFPITVAQNAELKENICLMVPVPLNSLEKVTGGSIACTTARRQVISALRATSKELGRISLTSARNQTIRTSARQALTGVRDATTGITQVVLTLLAGGEPTQASQDRVESGFGTVKTALDKMAGGPSANVTRRITRAKGSLNKAMAARDKLVVECRNSNTSPSSTATAGTLETGLASSEAVSSTSLSETETARITLTGTTIILTAETTPPLPTDIGTTTEAVGDPVPSEVVEGLATLSPPILTLTGSATILSTDVILPTAVAVVSDSIETPAASAPQA